MSRKTIIFLGAMMTLVVGLADLYTGINISLKLFYLLPVALVTWFAGRKAGYAMVVIGIAAWLPNFLIVEGFTWLNLIWSAFERIVIFSGASFMLDLIHQHFELRLQKAQEQYTSIVENAIEGIIAIDRNSTIRFVNTRAASLLGYIPSTMTGQDIHNVVHDEQSHKIISSLLQDHLLKGDPKEVQFLRSDGAGVWTLVSTTTSPNQLDDSLSTILLLTDITELKRYEKEVQAWYHQVSVLQRLTFGLTQSLDLDIRLKQSLDLVLELTKFDAGCIYLVDDVQNDLELQFHHGLSDSFIERVRRWKIGEGITGKAATVTTGLFVEDAEFDTEFDQSLRKLEDIHGFASIPLVSKEKVLGVLSIILRSPYVFSEDLRAMLQTFGKQIGIALENGKLYKATHQRERQLRQMSLEIVRLQEDERRRFAREIHDGLSQVLTMLKINTELALKHYEGERGKAFSYVQEVLNLASEAEIEAKQLANDLRPAILDDFGLKAAVKLHGSNFERRTGITVELHLPFYDVRFDPVIETSMYRIIQELLGNVAKHAGASKVAIQFLIRDGLLALNVSDNGKGFIKSSSQPNNGEVMHHGLRNIKERVEFFGGSFRVESMPNHGTEVMIEIPIRQNGEEQNRKGNGLKADIVSPLSQSTNKEETKIL